MDAITGAVVMVGLQKIGGPASELIKDFLSKVLAPTGEALGTALAHPIAEWQRQRVDRARKLIEDAAASVQAAGKEPQPIPGRLLMPILERGSLEEDEELRQRWVNLLANAAASSPTVLPAFVSILGELSPVEARVLRRIHHLQLEQRFIRAGEGGPDPDAPRRLDELDGQMTISSVKEYVGLTADWQMNVITANLQRLNLIDLLVTVDQPDLHSVRLKTLGRALLDACTDNGARLE